MVNPHGDDNSHFFFFAILYAICFQLTEKTNVCQNEDELKNDINKVDLSELFLIKNSLRLDFDILKFKQQCLRVNHFLNKWKDKYFTSSDERLYIDLRRSKGHTGEFERVNRNDSDLTVTIELKNALTKK